MTSTCPCVVPALLVLSPAVQQIQHRIFHLRVGVVVRRRVDVGAAPGPRHLRQVPLLAHRPTRHVLQAVVVGVRRGLGHLDGAVVPTRAEERPCCRIRDDGAIDRQAVVMEPHHLRGCRDIPEPIRFFAHVEALPQSHAHLLGVRCSHAKHDPVVRVDAGIGSARDVQGIWSAVGGGLLRGAGTGPHGCANQQCQQDTDLHGFPLIFRVRSPPQFVLRRPFGRPWTIALEPLPHNSQKSIIYRRRRLSRLIN